MYISYSVLRAMLFACAKSYYKLIVFFLAITFSVSASAQSNVWIVKDTSDASVTTTAGMTLRGAISKANSTSYTGAPDTIRFDLPDNEYPFVFKPRANMYLTAPVYIDGYSQGNIGSAHTDPTKIAMQGPIGKRALQIILDGSMAPSAIIFNLNGANSQNITISGLVFNNANRILGKAIQFPPNINLPIHVWGCYFGTDVKGMTAVPATSVSPPGYGTNFGQALFFSNATVNAPVYIGTNGDGINDANEGNLISNFYYGIDMTTTAASSNKIYVSGNYLGTNARCASTNDVLDLDTSMIPISAIRVGLAAGTGANVVIGIENATTASDSLKRNIISGNRFGVNIASSFASTPVIIAGNYIGVAKDGATPIPNRKDYTNIPLSGVISNGCGVYLAIANSNAVRIGSDGNNAADSLEGNVISGNQTWGISMGGNNHIVAGNYIGTDKSGMIGVPNGSSGISGNDDRNVGYIIGVSPNSTLQFPQFERNIISGNGEHGIAIKGDKMIIAGNYIGLGKDGVTNLGNGYGYNYQQNPANNRYPGIIITGVNAVTYPGKKNRFCRIGTLGGTRAQAERNVIGYNSLHGITFNHGAYDTIAGNYLGIDINKNSAFNTGAGVRIISCDSMIIGAPNETYSPALANIVANNLNSGIVVSGTASDTYGPSKRIRIAQNSFYKNKFLPLDLNYNNIVDVNDGVYNATQNNIGLDYPIYTNYAMLPNGDISVEGYVGVCNNNNSDNAGTTIPGNLTLEVYAEDNDGDQNGTDCGSSKPHGEGRTYLGSVTFPSTTNYKFSTSFTPVVSSDLYTGKNLTGITIDADGNTSEFGTYTKVIILPIKLSYFTGLANPNGNLLQWTTTMEQAFSKFEVEYSNNGKDFIVAGTVNSQGSPAGSKYNFLHTNVSGLSYYRLKCIDIDGNFTYSNIIMISPVNSLNNLQVLSISPVPFHSAMNLSIASDKNRQLKVILFDVNGKQCKIDLLNVEKGTGVYQLTNFDNLSADVYILKVSDGADYNKSFRVVKI